MKYFVVDAFADDLFSGNPAGVCVLDKWIDDAILQNIAIENNLSDTAYIVKNGNNYDLRWFAPGGEMDLCGHATLGSAFIMMNFYDKNANMISFNTKSGILTVKKEIELYEMDFPAYDLKPVGISGQMEKAIGIKPLEAWTARDLICVLENEDLIYQANINMTQAMELDGLLFHITAKGTKYDCVSRTFAPKMGVNEDPVCGSGHCHIVPLWSHKLNRKSIVARQASKRGGTLYCENNGDRVKISGKAKLYLEGELKIQ